VILILLTRQHAWTDAEIEALRSMYTSRASFRDLLDELPSRSPNSIRLMASRLGLKRPAVITGLYKVREVKATPSGGVLLRCSHCGEWIGVSAIKADTGGVVVCDHCGGVSLI
jgi:hypothetical protein